MKLYPGWQMTVDQHWRYISLCNQVYAALGLTKTADKEACRKRLHTHAFGEPISAKVIDHLKMFDAFKAQCLAILQPADLDGQLAQANMWRTRYKHAIRALADDAFWQAIAHDRFGTTDLDELSEEQLTQLRNTCAKRTTPAAINQRRRRRQETLTLAIATDDNNPF